jgi:hypothetical protein
MATRSTIGYETPDGGYVGCHAHYDGYPEHMGPILSEMLPADVAIMVNRGLTCGGIRTVEEDRDHTFFDKEPPNEPITQWPSCDRDYSYRKRLDGTLEWIDSSGLGVNIYEPKK